MSINLYLQIGTGGTISDPNRQNKKVPASEQV